MQRSVRYLLVLYYVVGGCWGIVEIVRWSMPSGWLDLGLMREFWIPGLVLFVASVACGVGIHKRSRMALACGYVLQVLQFFNFVLWDRSFLFNLCGALYWIVSVPFERMFLVPVWGSSFRGAQEFGVASALWLNVFAILPALGLWWLRRRPLGPRVRSSRPTARVDARS